MVSLRFLEAAELQKLRPHWESLYELQRTQGMSVPIPADGFDLWLASMEPLLGRYTIVAAAETEGTIVGFAAGRIRTAPAYFGGQPAGYVSEVYIATEHRSQGLGGGMLRMMVDWFHEQRIARVELHVIAGNDAGLRFYRRHGWQVELLQLVQDRS